MGLFSWNYALLLFLIVRWFLTMNRNHASLSWSVVLQWPFSSSLRHTAYKKPLSALFETIKNMNLEYLLNHDFLRRFWKNKNVLVKNKSRSRPPEIEFHHLKHLSWKKDSEESLTCSFLRLEEKNPLLSKALNYWCQ